MTRSRAHQGFGNGSNKRSVQYKVRKVMREYSHGKLHSGSKHGPTVTNYRQALGMIYR